MSAPVTAAIADLEPAEIARRSGSNFLIGFACLPQRRREGMTAIYAFCRVVDDAADDAADATVARERLAFWRDELERAAAGTPATKVGRALQRTFAAFGGGPAPLHELLDGMAMDLDGPRFDDLPALEVYCHRVASTVGLACLPVLGVGGPVAERFARELGLALQLTNILRDLAADTVAGRCYVPQRWLDESGVDPAWLAGGGVAMDARRSAAVATLCERLLAAAEAHFAAASRALRELPFRLRQRLLPARIMAAVYRDLLQRLRRRGADLDAGRVRVPRSRKLWLLARTALGGDA